MSSRSTQVVTWAAGSGIRTGATAGSGTETSAAGSNSVSTGATARVTMNAAQFQALSQAAQPPQPSYPAPQPTQVAPAQDPSFTVKAGQANTNHFIDYTISTGIKLCQAATALLPKKFSAEGQDVIQFCELLLDQAEKSGWNSTQADRVNITVDRQAFNIFTGYGQVSTQDITTNSTYLGNQDRRAKNDAQFYHCI